MHRIAKVASVVRSALVLGASLVLCLGLPGGAGTRPARTPAELLTLRQAHDADYAEQASTLMQRLVAQTNRRHDAYAAGRAAAPPTVELLVISGGDWGAFGAGFLQGWSRVQGAMALPQFDAVTGVSTGALIAPFAFLGAAPSLDTIAALYRHPQPAWVRRAGRSTSCRAMPPSLRCLGWNVRCARGSMSRCSVASPTPVKKAGSCS